MELNEQHFEGTRIWSWGSTHGHEGVSNLSLGPTTIAPDLVTQIVEREKDLLERLAVQ